MHLFSSFHHNDEAGGQARSHQRLQRSGQKASRDTREEKGKRHSHLPLAVGGKGDVHEAAVVLHPLLCNVSVASQRGEDEAEVAKDRLAQETQKSCRAASFVKARKLARLAVYIVANPSV